MSEDREVSKPITAKDTAKVVTPNANALPRRIEESDHARFIAAMRESEAAVRNGQVQDIDRAFSEIRGALGL
jgi:hypothetical protein